MLFHVVAMTCHALQYVYILEHCIAYYHYTYYLARECYYTLPLASAASLATGKEQWHHQPHQQPDDYTYYHIMHFMRPHGQGCQGTSALKQEALCKFKQNYTHIKGKV